MNDNLSFQWLEGRFGILLELIPDAVLITAPSGEIIIANTQAGQMFGYDERDSLIGMSIDALLPERYRAAHVHAIEGYFDDSRVRRMGSGFDLYGLKKDGTEFSIDALLSPLETPFGKHAFCAIRDLTAQKLADLRIQRLNRVYAVLSDVSGLIVQACDRNFLFREACRIAIEAGKFSLGYIALGDPPKVAAMSSMDPGLVEKLQASLDESSIVPGGLFDQFWRQGKPIVINNIRRDLPTAAQLVSDLTETRSLCALPLIVDGKVIGLFGLRAREPDFFDEEELELLMRLAGDISLALAHIEKISQLHYAAYYDQLTGLANATLFRERLSEHTGPHNLKRTRALVAIVDLERFSNIHQTFGRCLSDALLRQTARRLEACMISAVSVARLNADCFALMVTDLDEENEIARIVDKVLACFDEPFQLGDVEFKAAAKVGISLCPDDGNDADTLFTNAEAALKKAKAAGKRSLFYTQKMNERVAAQTLLESQLRRAVENEEFVLHYQPKLDLSNGRLVSAEALIRWNNPDTGLVSPAHFIPLLEETGMILEVGAWALRRAVSDHEVWREHVLNAPRIAVNVSAIQLHQHEFVDVLRDAITSLPSPIDIEITESLIMDGVEENIGKLRLIRDLGANISIDDFGTGYSSLAYLAKLPIKEIKIDRLFVSTMLEDPNTLTLVSTMISLGHALGLNVVAEGVETEEQAKMLRLLRCDTAQGFLFGKPMSFDEITALIGRDVDGPTNAILH